MKHVNGSADAHVAAAPRESAGCPGGPARDRTFARGAALLFAVSLAVYAAFTHGGILSPDSEAAFRTAESLAFRGTFAVGGYLDGWEGFGFAPGRDGRLYSRYQPLQPLLLAPLVRLARPLSRCERLQRLLQPLPGSHYVKWSPPIVLGRPPADAEPHLLRFLVVMLYVGVSALNVVMFAAVVRRMTGSDRGALLAGVIFAFCTLNLSYAGTLFKEPLVGVLTLGSFHVLLGVRPGTARNRAARSAASGLLGGMAAATHLLAIPFLPFLCLLSAGMHGREGGGWRGALRGAAWWCAGAIPVLAALAWHNYARFGDVLDTGFRASAQEAVERRFFSPVDGVSGLLFSAGKGLFLFCPIVIPSLLLWPAFHRRHGLLSWFILAAALSRLLLVGAFRDWHGGFCLGPRYLVNALPFLLLPLAVRVADLVRHGTARGQGGMLLVAWAALCQQVYFGMGEIFSFLYRVKWAGLRVGGDVFKDDFLYFNWTVSPLWRLFEGQRGPYLLRRAALGDGPLFVTLCGLGLLGLLWAWVRACGRAGQRQTAAAERAG